MADVEAAAGRIAGQAVRTPLLTAPALDDAVGARVFVKPECLQRTGSFKFRGAYNRLAMMTSAERAKGVVAASSGNHAQGVAEAARLFGVPATIVMPSDAPAIKRARTERSGAKVVPYDRDTEDRLAIAKAITAETGGTYVAPYDDPGVMAGQGTTGLEIAADLSRLGVEADHVLVPTGGGGLLSGTATALKAKMPCAVCHSVEPEGFDDTARSLESGARETNAATSGSIADALMAQSPGAITFPVNRALAGKGYHVADEVLLHAMAFAAAELKLITEPGGVIALAAALEAGAMFEGQTIVVVISGGNVDPDVFARALVR
ncbi:MAG: threonine/serine dehydratase [Pseudomonadota bacterium]